ncbi:MAG: methionine synthase [Alphaproteobacteria bacterium]|nr:methionine synthase [Alphaproteobacteria bacterium]
MQGHQDRILTTHVGSLPRTTQVLNAMKAKLSGGEFSEESYQTEIARGVKDIVKKQADLGIDVVADGEMSKSGFFTYIEERMNGFEARKDEKFKMFEAEIEAFPEYYEDYFARAMLGGTVVPMFPMYCVGPVSYKGHDLLQRDIDNLKAALDGVDVEGVFIPATAPAGVGYNDYYNTEEEFAEAVAEALREEYEAIVDAGFLLQIDDPFLCDILVDPELNEKEMDKKANTYVEAINHSTRNIPEEKIRFHTCYGINEGPRIHEAPGGQVAKYMLNIKAGGYSFEAANPRHEHEWKVWGEVDLPDDKVLIHGVISHSTNVIEHPELVAERIVRLANLIGRERVMAGTDCGFAQSPLYQRVHPSIMWAKLGALVEGAEIASRELWN